MSLSVHIRKKIKKGGSGKAEMLDVNFEFDGEVLALPGEKDRPGAADGNTGAVMNPGKNGENLCNVLAVLGETGGGKTTLFRCIAGLEKPDEGSIILNGKVLFDSLQKINIPSAKRRVLYISMDSRLKDNGLKKRKTVEENLRMLVEKATRDQDRRCQKRAKVSAKDRKLIADHRTAELLKEYHLDGMGGFYPKDLSGRQKYDLLLAAAAAHEPELILLDEPFHGFDPYLKEELLTELKWRSTGCIGGNSVGKGAAGHVTAFPEILFATANPDEAYAIGPQILSVSGWRSQRVRRREDFFRNPGTFQAGILSGCRNITKADQLDPFHAFSPDWGCMFVFSEPNLENQEIKFEDKGKKKSEESPQSTAPGLKFSGERDRIRSPKNWKKLPTDFSAIGIRQEDFLASLPEGAKESDYYRFTVHVQRIEETLTDWQIWFQTGRMNTPESVNKLSVSSAASVSSGSLPNGKSEILSVKTAAKTAELSVRKPLLWQVPKAEISREEINRIRRLYVSMDRIMILTSSGKA